MENGDFMTGIISLIIIIVLFLIFRALVLWYWKVDKIVGYLKIIAEHFDRLDHSELKEHIAQSSNTDVGASLFEICPKCGKESQKRFNVCEHCGEYKR